MSTDIRRVRARRRRSRGFLLAFTVVIGVLAVVAGVGATVTVAQGPRLTDVSVDPAAAVSASGARVILTTTQSLQKVDAAQVEVTPATPFTVDTSGRALGLRFSLPLRDDSDYTVRVRDVRGVGQGPAAVLEYAFRTPPLQVFTLQRGTADGDAIVRSGIDGADPATVFTHPHIEDFRATSAHLAVSVQDDADRTQLLVTELDGGNPRALALPGDGFVSELQSADRGERIGFTFSDAGLSAEGGRESVLYTVSLAAGAAGQPPTPVAIAGGETRVADWRFVPDTDRILLLTFDARLLLVASDGGDPAPLGSALMIDGIARGSSQAVVERLEGRVVIDLTDGAESPLVEPDPSPGIAGHVVPLPGSAAGTLRTYAELDGGSTLLGTRVIRVGDDGSTRPLVEFAPQDGVLQQCASPSGRYAAVLVAPDGVDNPYDRYQLPLPERLETRIVDLDSGRQVSALAGFGVSWCQVPPS